VYIAKMISHLQSYSTEPDPMSLHVQLLNSLQSQFSLNDGTPHDQRYRRTEPMQGGTPWPMSLSWSHKMLTLLSTRLLSRWPLGL